MENLGTFMNILTDFGFKRLFGTEEFKHVLMRFLNVLFEPEGIKVTNVVYHNKEVLPPNPDGKRIVYDVYCTTPGQKEHFILEMQQEHHLHLEKRLVYYLAKGLAGQGISGDKYDYKPVYGIFFVDFQFRHISRKLLHDFQLREKDTRELFSNLLRLLIVCLEEVKESWEECETELEKIAYLIKNMHHMDKESKAYKSMEYSEFFDASEIGSFAAEDVVAYSKSVRAYEDRELYRESGYDDGFQDGEAVGIRKGIEQGIEQGAARERINSISMMASIGVSPNDIAKAYNMPVSDIQKILMNLNN